MAKPIIVAAAQTKPGTASWKFNINEHYRMIRLAVWMEQQFTGHYIR